MGETRLGLLVVATWTRLGLRGRWMMMGDFLPWSICSCAMEARSRQCKSSSKASRRARRRRWKIGAPGGSAFKHPLVRKSLKAVKWEHLEELCLWIKHVVGLMSDIINNGLASETMQSREQVVLAEEVATKAREEAVHYKVVAAELDKEKRLVESDLVAVRDAYCGIKEEHLKSKIARGTVEEAGKKARDDLEVERTRSHGLSDNVDRLRECCERRRKPSYSRVR